MLRTLILTVTALGLTIADQITLKAKQVPPSLPQLFYGHFNDFGTRQSVILALVSNEVWRFDGWQLYKAWGQFHLIRVETIFDPRDHSFVLREFPPTTAELPSPDPIAGTISADFKTVIGVSGDKNEPAPDFILRANFDIR